ncbi:MAG TPA: hypothetical protein VK745_27555 [Polyangiaceae bacterium]|nr:hypothetical protein [Polyangiaceae bacterium]
MTARDSDPELLQLDPAEEERLAQALRCAFAPSELDPARHERLLAAALEDPFAPASPEELVESERFRRALDGDGDHLDLALARAMSAAHAPKPAAIAAISRAALPVERRRAKVSYLSFAGTAAALAAAAAVLLTMGSRESRAPTPDLQALTLAQSRSTAPLFQSAALAGAPSLRIDRIASVRERELRENRFALWGVR